MQRPGPSRVRNKRCALVQDSRGAELVGILVFAPFCEHGRTCVNTPSYLVCFACKNAVLTDNSSHSHRYGIRRRKSVDAIAVINAIDRQITTAINVILTVEMNR